MNSNEKLPKKKFYIRETLANLDSIENYMLQKVNNINLGNLENFENIYIYIYRYIIFYFSISQFKFVFKFLLFLIFI